MSCKEPCVKYPSEEGLVIYINIDDLRSWDLNTELILHSTKKMPTAISDNIHLFDYGITSFDYGLTDKVYNQYDITPFDDKMKLQPVKFNLSGSGTHYNFSSVTYDYSLSSNTDTIIGKYFELNGGWVSGNFALEGYPFEVAPKRFLKGFAIRTWVKLSTATFSSITSDNDGFIYYMGTRAENKYAWGVTGETEVHTSALDFLATSESLSATTKDAIEGCVFDNILGFRITDDYKIGYVRIDDKGYVQSDYSEKCISFDVIPLISGGSGGWVEIGFNWKPKKNLTIFEKDCPPRLGDLTIYFNGRPLHVFKDFKEIIMKGCDDFKEKQINTPYVIAWGGGSYGLRHHFHFDYDLYDFYTPIDDAYISGNTIYNNTVLQLSSSTETYITTSGETKNIVEGIYLSGLTTINEIEFDFVPNIFALSNRPYEIVTYFRNDNIFMTGSTSTVSLEINNVEYELVEDLPYTFTKNLVNDSENWYRVSKKIKLKNNVLPETFDVSLRLTSDLPLKAFNPFYFTSVSKNAPDKLFHDNRKDDLLVEQMFGGNTIIAIQKLKIYDRSLSPTEWIDDFAIEGKIFGYKKTKGGRIINIYV